MEYIIVLFARDREREREGEGGRAGPVVIGSFVRRHPKHAEP